MFWNYMSQIIFVKTFFNETYWFFFIIRKIIFIIFSIIYFILKIGTLNCISLQFLNLILLEIIGKSFFKMDFRKINFIYDILKDNIVQHSKDIYSCYIINSLIVAFHIIKSSYLQKFQINEEI